MDRIVVEELDNGRRRRCVSCGFDDVLLNDGAVEPATRLSRRRGPETPVAVVRLVDPAEDGKTEH